MGFPARNRSVLVLVCLLAALLPALALAQGAERGPWKFGIISDTQWSPAEGRPGRGVATEIIDNVNEQFIAHGVEFVIAVGDVTDNGSRDPSELDIRARHTAALHRRGIGFFPLRGNHEWSVAAARQWPRSFPRLPGLPGFRGGTRYFEAGSPDLPGLAGLTYSFSFGNATFLLLDIFAVDDGSASGTTYSIHEQQEWITEQLESASRAGRHAFLFAHKNLLGQNHKDNVFGDPLDQDDPGDRGEDLGEIAGAFYRAMHGNGARYFFCGHDHIYHRAIVRSPQAPEALTIQQIITGSNSHKMYSPKPPYSDNEIPLMQQRRAVGYLIVTVDGPRVQVDTYAVVMPGEGSLQGWEPVEQWPLLDRFGYSANGQSFVVRRGESLTAVADRAPTGDEYLGTVMRILDGTNDRAGIIEEADAADNRECSNLVATGWSPRTEGARSDILHLWGMRTTPGSAQTSEYVLALSYEGASADGLALLSRDEAGRWVNAVSLNTGGEPRAVMGPYRPEYGLGTYGIDPARRVAWAVVNHDGEFVASVQP